MTSLLPLAEAQQRLLAQIAPLPVETLTVEASAGRWLAEPSPRRARNRRRISPRWMAMRCGATTCPARGRWWAKAPPGIHGRVFWPRDSFAHRHRGDGSARRGAVIIQEDCAREGILSP
jgi:hypothetical protein